MWRLMPVKLGVLPCAPTPLLGLSLAIDTRPLLTVPFGHAMGRGTATPEAEAEEPLSLETMFRRHFDDVHRIVASLLGPGASSADVEDLTQQVFLSAHRALPRFRRDSKVTTWLYGIASNVVLTHLRSRRRRNRLREALEGAAHFTDAPRGPEDEAHARREILRVWRHLMRIEAKKRIVFILYEVEGLSGAEIAQSLGLKEGTVWTRLHHARRNLVDAMRKDETP